MSPPTKPLRVVIPIAPGVEEMEAVILADVFRRASWDVVLAGLGPGPVTASRGVRLLPDQPLAELSVEQVDLFALPGGMGGVQALCADETVLAWCRHVAQSKSQTLAAICAAAMVLDRAGVLGTQRFTCHPGVIDQVKSGTHQSLRIVQDGHLHTSQGPGTAFEFALHLVRELDSPERAAALQKEMCQ